MEQLEKIFCKINAIFLKKEENDCFFAVIPVKYLFAHPWMSRFKEVTKDSLELIIAERNWQVIMDTFFAPDNLFGLTDDEVITEVT